MIDTERLLKVQKKFEKYLYKLKDKGYISQWYYNGSYHIMFTTTAHNGCGRLGWSCKNSDWSYCGFYATCSKKLKDGEKGV